MIVFESYYQILLIFHGLMSFLLVGSMTHNLFCVVDYLKGRFNRKKQELKFAKWAFFSYLAIYISGCLIYPAFRVHMRYRYFDENFPWVTGLFEVKEHWGAIALAIFFAYYILRKSFDPSEEKQKLYLYIPLCFLINLIMWYEIIVGIYLTHLKGAF